MNTQEISLRAAWHTKYAAFKGNDPEEQVRGEKMEVLK